MFEALSPPSPAPLPAYGRGKMPDEIRAALAAYKRRHLLKQEELARLIGVSRPQLANAGQRRFGLSEGPAMRLLELLSA